MKRKKKPLKSDVTKETMIMSIRDWWHDITYEMTPLQLLKIGGVLFFLFNGLLVYLYLR